LGEKVQGVEEEVVTFRGKLAEMYQEFFTTGGAMESRLEGMCVDNKEGLVKVLDTFICLEKGIKENTDQIVQLDDNQSWLKNWEKGMSKLVGEVQ
jgi:hypothetical protein